MAFNTKHILLDLSFYAKVNLRLLTWYFIQNPFQSEPNDLGYYEPRGFKIKKCSDECFEKAQLETISSLKCFKELLDERAKSKAPLEYAFGVG